MARIVKPLSPTEIKNAKPKEKEYTLSDGEGLLLLILPSGSKSWRFNYARPVTGKAPNSKVYITIRHCKALILLKSGLFYSLYVTIKHHVILEF